MFKTLSNKIIPVLWNYFGASHGKGEVDGVIGRLSMIIDAVVCSGTFEFGNCKELTAYCQHYLKMGDNSRGICCHYHRQYYEVLNIVRVEDTDDIHTIRVTLGFHLVRNTETIFENTLWNSTSDKYVPMECPVAKHWTVMLNAPSKYPNSTTREITVYDDKSDCDNLNSCDSDMRKTSLCAIYFMMR